MKYSRSLDLILAALKNVSAGNTKVAGLAFSKAMEQADFKPTLAALEKQQAAAFEVVREANPSVASMFETLAAKAKAKKKAKVKAKGKPFGGKQAPPFKKKVKAADESEDDEEEDESEDDEEDDEETSDTTMTGTDPTDLEPVLREMTLSEDEGDEGFGNNDDDLTLEDLESLDGVEEMPEASLDDSEDLDLEDDFTEVSEDYSEDDELDLVDEDEVMAKKTVASATKKSKVKVVSSNLDALDRLRLSVSRKSASR